MSGSNFEPCFQFQKDNFEKVGSNIPYIVNAVLNIPFSLVATVANILVFLAIRKTNLRLPFKFLLGNLVLTDVGIGVVVQPSFAVFLLAKARSSSSHVLCISRASTSLASTTLVCVSIITMTLISLDRYIAFRHHFHYHDLVTTKRVGVSLVLVWLFSGVLAFLFLRNLVFAQYIGIAHVCICLFVTSTSYAKIYRGLRRQYGPSVRHAGQVVTENRGEQAINISKYRRTASTMLLVYCLSLLCYVPLTCAAFVMKSPSRSVLTRCIFEFSATIAFFNSCLNPFVYCWCLHDIREAVRRTLFDN